MLPTFANEGKRGFWPLSCLVAYIVYLNAMLPHQGQSANMDSFHAPSGHLVRRTKYDAARGSSTRRPPHPFQPQEPAAAAFPLLGSVHCSKKRPVKLTRITSKGRHSSKMTDSPSGGLLQQSTSAYAGMLAGVSQSMPPVAAAPVMSVPPLSPLLLSPLLLSPCFCCEQLLEAMPKDETSDQEDLPTPAMAARSNAPLWRAQAVGMS